MKNATWLKVGMLCLVRFNSREVPSRGAMVAIGFPSETFANPQCRVEFPHGVACWMPIHTVRLGVA